MLLLVAIVQSEDVAQLCQRLLEQEFRLTQINATGGFLAAGSSVLLLGVEEQRLPVVLATIETICQTRSHFVNATPWLGAVGLPPVTSAASVEVLVGGAVVFGFPVQRFLHLTGDSAPLAADLHDVAPNHAMSVFDEPLSAAQRVAREGMTGMTLETAPGVAGPTANADSATKLIIAIVQNDDASAVVDALLAAGHRLTRLNAAGGFLRRGNATLLIGVESHQLDEVLALIQANCRPRGMPTPPQEGASTHGATVFVLDASHFERF